MLRALFQCGGVNAKTPDPAAILQRRKSKRRRHRDWQRVYRDVDTSSLTNATFQSCRRHKTSGCAMILYHVDMQRGKEDFQASETVLQVLLLWRSSCHTWATVCRTFSHFLFLPCQFSRLKAASCRLECFLSSGSFSRTVRAKLLFQKTRNIWFQRRGT